VVKLIDTYPDEVAGQAVLGGYQLMVSANIFRARYRESPEPAFPYAFTRRVRRDSSASGDGVFLCL
jgi:hypothetical protein